MGKIIWKRDNKEKNDKLHWLSDRYVLVICLLIAKRKKTYREKWEGKDLFSQYVDLCKESIKSELFEKSPYKQILEQINESSTSKELQNQILEELKTYSASYETTISNWTCAAMTMLICTPILVFLGLLFLITGKNLTLGILLPLFSVLLLISSLRFIVVKRKPSRNINFFLNTILSDRKAFNSLNELYNEITNIQKTDVSIINVNQTDIKIENTHNEYNLVNNNNTQINNHYTLLENSSLKTKKNIKKTNRYEGKTKEELVEIFNKKYETYLNEYPHFFYILQNIKYQNCLILKPDYEFYTKKFEKTVLSSLGTSQKDCVNDIELIKALFNPKFRNISKAMTQDLSNSRINDFEKFLSINETKIETGIIKT